MTYVRTIDKIDTTLIAGLLGAPVSGLVTHSNIVDARLYEIEKRILQIEANQLTTNS